MSLLMDALRQVERSKQQAVVVDNPPMSPVRGNCPGEDTGLPEVCATVDLTLEEDIDSPAAAGPVVAAADEEAEQASPASAQETVDLPDTPAAPVMAISGASVEASKQAARMVFAAQRKHRRVAYGRRLLLMGLAGFAMLGATGFLLYPYQSMVNFASPLVTGRRAEFPAEPVNVPNEATVAGAVTLSGAPPADLAESSAGNDDAGLSGRETAADRTPSPAQTAADSPRPLEPVVHPKIVPGPSSTMPAASPRPELPSGQVLPASAQTEPDLEPLPQAEPQPLARPAAITITRRAQSPPQSDPLSAAAYAAYQRGSFDQARRNFQLILQADPDHRGAMLGLAALALRRNEQNLARDLYLRLLEQDPSDPLARAGLMTIAAIMPKGDQAGMESELKLLIEVHPNIAPLHFTLGNLYAAGRRWNEARQAYFNALQAAGKTASEPSAVSPDYPFNLAVSLEHLNQTDLAGKYYREALALADDHPAGFDRQALRSRLDTFNRTKRNEPEDEH